MSDSKSIETTENATRSLAAQAWLGLAFWLSFGLLLEGLIGYRSPAYLQDEMRRDLFRLAHAHGAIFSLLLAISWLYLRSSSVTIPNVALWSLRLGTILMPIGFLLGGMWHTETDPNLLIVLAPIGGVMVIFGVVSVALTSLQRPARK